MIACEDVLLAVVFGRRRAVDFATGVAPLGVFRGARGEGGAACVTEFSF